MTSANFIVPTRYLPIRHMSCNDGKSSGFLTRRIDVGRPFHINFAVVVSLCTVVINPFFTLTSSHNSSVHLIISKPAFFFLLLGLSSEDTDIRAMLGPVLSIIGAPKLEVEEPNGVSFGLEVPRRSGGIW